MKLTIGFCITLLALAATAAFNSSHAAQLSQFEHEQLTEARAMASRSLSDDEQLKLAALEGLMAAPPERALPLLRKVLNGKHSDAVKSRALFVLGQIELPEAQQVLAETARNGSGTLQLDAIRSIGIGGVKTSLDALPEIYRSGNSKVRESVLQAYLIADDTAAVYAVARDAADDEEFDAAVRMLGTMGATAELSALADKGNTSQGLIQAYSIAGDLEGLQKMASQATDPEQRATAIRSMGIIGNAAARAALLDLYRQASDDTTRDAALQGMLISEHDEGVLELFRASTDSAEKSKLLRVMMNMDSDLALELIDATLEEK